MVAIMVSRIKKILDPVVVIASVTLLVALSVEIIGGERAPFSRWYVNLQLIICLLFIADYIVMTLIDKRPIHYFFSHVIILIISLPYLSILPNNGGDMHREWAMVVSVMPQLRAFVALYIVIRWITREQTFARLFYAYILSMLSLTYLSALLFYDCEINLNPNLAGFGDALWWAGMGLTTVGTSILPTTATGKILSVIMPLLGMMMLPIATSYLVSRYKHR